MSDATVTGADEVVLKMQQMARRVQYPRPAWERVADAFGRFMKRQFETGGASAGKAWAPLDPAYMRWKVDRGFAPDILVRTGRLKRSLTERPFGVETFTRDGVTLGTDVEYAKFHQFGTDTIPARPMLRTNEDFEDEINDILARYVLFSDL